MIISCFVMFNNCFAKEQQEAKTIFTFKKEVGLTDVQEDKIKSMLFDIQQSSNVNKNKLNVLSNELNSMIKNKSAIASIRKKLEEISKIQIDLACIDIENGRKIESALTPDQLRKWNDIKIKEAEVARK